MLGGAEVCIVLGVTKAYLVYGGILGIKRLLGGSQVCVGAEVC